MHRVCIQPGSRDTITIPSISRPGIRPGFPSLASYRKAYQLSITDQDEMIARLTRYAAEGAGFEAHFGFGLGSYSYSVANANSDLLRSSNALKWHAIHGAIEGTADWLAQWQQAVAFDYWNARQTLTNVERHLARTLGQDTSVASAGFQLSGWRSLVETGAVVGDCLALGWTDWALALARRVNVLVNDARIHKEPDSLHPRTQFLVFRLIDDWQGWPEAVAPECLGGDAILDAVLAHWRTADPDQLAPLLLAACDRRTHESRPNSNKASYELSSKPDWYDPFEIHAVLRLRESLGLANPSLDHLLMKGPLGRLPATAAPWRSDLLDGVVAQLRKFYPEL